MFRRRKPNNYKEEIALLRKKMDEEKERELRKEHERESLDVIYSDRDRRKKAKQVEKERKKMEKRPLLTPEEKFDAFLEEECGSGCKLCMKCQQKLRDMIP